MRLLQIEMENFRSHANLDLDLEGLECAAVVGSNGAGKSSLLLAIEYALYGGSHDELLSRWADKGGVRLLLEQGGQRWRVNRGRERNKKSWCVVEREDAGTFKPLPMHKIAETQAYIEEAITGMDADAFRATVYAPQGEVGVLASLSPGQRKALLGGLLGLEQYEGWREKAALDGRGARSEAESARERLGDLESRLVEAQMRFEDTESVQNTRTLISDELADQEKGLDAAIAREAMVEKVRRRQQLVTQMNGVKERAREVKERKDRQAAIFEEIKKVEDVAAELMDLQVEKDAARDAEARIEAAEEAVKTALMQVVQAENRAANAKKGVQSEEAGLAELSAPGAKCSLCGQEIAGEHREKALANAEGTLFIAREQQAEADGEVAELKQAAETAKAAVPALASDYDETAYTQAQEATMKMRQLQGEMSGLRSDETVEGLQEEWKRLGDEARELPKEVPEGPSPAEVRERIKVCHERLDRLDETLRNDAAARKEASELEGERGGLQTTVEESEVDERAYAVVAKAFSRDGIPAMVLDNAVGGIEAATNETLEQLGVEMSVRLVTQRTTKTGGLAETLDILVDDGTTEAPLESFSGGEQARVHIALRLGLATVLSAGTGLELGFLLIDEVPDVDVAGVEMLAELLSRLPQQILLVSHTPDLVDAMPQRVVVERSAGSASAVSVS